MSHQVEYLGLVENIRVRRAGFAYRNDYDRFLRRYKMISDKTWPNHKFSNSRDACQAIINSKNFDSDVKYGRTKIFIRSPQSIVTLESERNYYVGLIVVFLQKVWRGTLVRMRMKKIRAAKTILRYYNRYKLKDYVGQLESIAAITKQRYMHQQKGTVARACDDPIWPTPPKTLISTVSILKRIYQRWRAWLLLRRIPPPQWPEFRLKVIAVSCLRGKRPNYGLNERWLGNYVAQGGANERFNVATIHQSLQPGEKILFSTRIVKASPSMFKKNADRVLVVGERDIYKLDAANYKVLSRTPINEINSVGVSAGDRDQLVALHVRGGCDLICALVNMDNATPARPINLVGELVAVLWLQYWR